MAVFLAFVLLGGVGLLVVDGIFVLLWMGDLNADRVLRGVQPTPVGSWHPLAGRVAAEGIVDFGPAGRQIGPVSGEVCAWYRVTLRREPSRRSSDDAYDELLDVTSPGPPAFRDHSGRVLLDPRVLNDLRSSEPPVTQRTVKLLPRGAGAGAEIVPLQFRDLRRGETLELTEVRLPYALEVFALGRIAGPPVTLTAVGRDRSVLAVGSRDQIVAGRRADLATWRWMIRWFAVIGLVVTAVAAAALYLSTVR